MKHTLLEEILFCCGKHQEVWMFAMIPDKQVRKVTGYSSFAEIEGRQKCWSFRTHCLFSCWRSPFLLLARSPTSSAHSRAILRGERAKEVLLSSLDPHSWRCRFAGHAWSRFQTTFFQSWYVWFYIKMLFNQIKDLNLIMPRLNAEL